MKCPNCESEQFQKNGHRSGKQNYRCKNCGRQYVEAYAAKGYSEDTKQICIKMYRTGLKLREIASLTGISHGTVYNWVKQARLLPNTTDVPDDTI
ncbi:MAG: helix-turn-helix domain-containing protein [Drouetiella hepatica Uher 2000/2452]|uniref:Helix-turn-helix domain-containing protein n=1 Tax=Drouetiella hepatica Uher 2000/2452 TaxID=904376 RepID=A0A951UPU6_9CYAN|nr:helix-turn-helix domain-containing protein [Drouetiella hepatica Uher 2000/2452]